jgi:bacillithiol biosynthesis cysteine-adding enzyme BshC
MNTRSEKLSNHLFESVRFEDVTGQSALFKDFLSNDSRQMLEYWPNRDTDLALYAKTVLSNYDTNRSELCDGLEIENKSYKADADALKNIDLLRDEDCVAVITGQQAGLFSGPAYTVYKALSAIRIAGDLRTKGIKAVPVFWIATEDHDFEEISAAHVFGADAKIHTASVSANADQTGLQVGDIQYGDDVEQEIEHMFKALEASGNTEALRKKISAAYKTGVSTGKAFGILLAEVFSGYGLVFVNPLNPVIRRLASPLYCEAISKSTELKRRVLSRSRGLVEEGYHAQVLVAEDFLPFFFVSEEGKRRALREDLADGGFSTKDDGFSFSKTELLKLAETKPEMLSPNALLRPIVQDYVFPTVCYVGGAAEIAYFAQNSVIYDLFDRPVTPIRHRASFTILQSRHKRTLDAYGLGSADLFRGLEATLRSIGEKHADKETMELFLSAKDALLNFYEQFSEAFLDLDKGLTKNLEKKKDRINWHISALSEKFLYAESRRDADLNRRLNDLFGYGYPLHGLQERKISFIDFINRFGPDALGIMYDNVSERENTHKLLVL